MLHVRVDGPEWDPIFAYAESQQITPAQAARELLATAIASTPDLAFLAMMKQARAKIVQITYQAGARAMRLAYDEIIAQAVAAGISIEGLDG